MERVRLDLDLRGSLLEYLRAHECGLVRKSGGQEAQTDHIPSNDDHSKKTILKKSCLGWFIRASSSFFFFGAGQG